MIVLLDYKIIIFNSNGNDFCPLATYLYKYLTLIVLKKTHFKCIYDLQGRRVNAPQKVGCSKFRYKSDIKSARIQLVKLLTFNTLYCEIVL